MRTPETRSLRGLALAGVLVAASTAARAQDLSGDLQRYHPTPSPLGGLQQNSGEILDHMGWAVGVHANYAMNPLIARQASQRVAAIVQNNLTLHGHAAIGLLDFAELGIAAPFTVYQDSAVPGTLNLPVPPGTGMGDLRIEPRVRLLSQWRNGVALALSPTVTVPLGYQSSLTGDAGLGFRPMLDVSWRNELVQLMAGAGANLRTAGYVRVSNTSRTEITGSEVVLRASAAIRFTPDIQGLVDLNGGIPVPALDADTSPSARRGAVDIAAGARFGIADQWAFDVGVGAPFAGTPGIPDFRLVAGVTYGSGISPRPIDKCERADTRKAGRDTDKDGIDDACDLCPGEAETVNGVDDQDGCAEPDTDGDGVINQEDACPAEAGTVKGCPDGDKDGIADKDDQCSDVAGPAPSGCPDRDGDGVLDAVDACPDKKGVKPHGCTDGDGDGVPDKDDQCPAEKGLAPHGCADTDGDGVFDKSDKCPNVKGKAPTGCNDSDGDGVDDDIDACPDSAEDLDGFEDMDGCPESDNDKDGIPDAADKCPNEAETINGIDDADGCAEKDSDSDGIIDAQDKCPNEPETINGKKDDDGCPDKGASLVEFTGSSVEIKQQVQFKLNKADIEKKSFGLLDQVAAMLKAHPEIPRILVGGHTDPAGDRQKNLDLSQARAESVVKYLVGKGVPAAKLVAKGYGPDQPIYTGKKKKELEKNRRVEFKVLKDGEKP